MSDEAPTKFDFITDDALRDSLGRDYAEMAKSIEGESWKASLVLAGSIVEAVLVDALLAADFATRTGQDPLKMALAPTIEHCKKEGILSARTSELASVVRDYRNVIHPGKQYRTQDQPNREAALVARSLVDMISREVAAKRQASQGLTAQQLVTKLEIDPGAAKLIKHYTRAMTSSELRRFVTSSAEKRYFQLGENVDASSFSVDIFEVQSARRAIAQAYRSALQQVDDTIRAEAARRFISVLRDGTAERVREYGRSFFSASDLGHLRDDDRNFAKDYLFTEMNAGLDHEAFRMVSGLQNYLSVDDVNRFVDPLVRVLLSDKAKPTFKEEVDRFLRNEISEPDTAIHTAISKRLEAWRDHVTNDEEKKKVIAAIVGWRDIPF